MGVELGGAFWSSMMGAADHLLVGSGGAAAAGGMGERRLSAGSLPRRTCSGGGVALSSSPVISMSLRVKGANLCSTPCGEAEGEGIAGGGGENLKLEGKL